MSQNNYFKNEYIPGIVKWGKITQLLGLLLCFLPAIVVSFIYGYMPPFTAILAGLVMQLSATGIFAIVEPISYFPILGIAGTYMSFLSGNISNMRLPCAAVAQEAAGVKISTEEGSVISTIGIAVSIIVNLIILTIGAVCGNYILAMMPQWLQTALTFLLPALFGAVFGQFAITRPKLAVVSAIIGVGMTWVLKNGYLGFLPGTPSYVTTIVSVFGSIFMGRLLYKNELTDKAKSK
ncbi:MAG: hypothetical protein LBR30_03635 [Clostridioides sp.]|jgi:hypothetical protein|nr:hypothetical protein [Clostridioides sp.]